ncbi:MAG: hypothetical protein HY885_06705 [Deltaproteobacteria bacterium]|nr:hypothetical protein [Deltaproteobacteria bacterium]
MNVLIEDPEILSLCLPNLEGKRVFTENPYVYEVLKKKKYDVVGLDTLFKDNKKINEISEKSFILTEKWIDIINDYYKDYFKFPINIGSILSVHLYNLNSTCIYRFFEIINILSCYGKITFPYIDKIESKKNLVSIIDNNLFLKIASINSFSESIFFDKKNSSKYEKNKFYNVETEIKINNILYYLLALCSLSSTKHDFFLKYNKFLNNIFLHGNNRNIKCFILSKGLVISEISSFLLRSGIDVKNLELPNIPKEIYAGEITDAELEKNLVAVAEKEILFSLNKRESPAVKEIFQLLAGLTVSFISSYLIPVAHYLYSKIDTNLEKIDVTCKYILLSGSRSMELAIIRAIYADYEIPTIQFQEGTSCLLKLFQKLALLGYINEGDAFVSLAPHEENYYKKVSLNFAKIFYSYGAEEIMRPPLPKIGRMIGRKIWKISRKEQLILYVPTRYRGKVVRPYYELLDIAYWKYQKKMIFKVFAHLKSTVCIKIHKKGLLSTIDQREYPFEAIDLPQNVLIKQGPDLRFARVIADVIIVDTATSTLSWALLSGVPVIYMNHEQSPVEEEVRFGMEEALFVVDVKYDSCEWAEKLLQLLAVPRGELLRKWQGMRRKRELFLKEYITGYPRSKVDFLEWFQFVTDIGYKKLSTKYKSTNF